MRLSTPLLTIALVLSLALTFCLNDGPHRLDAAETEKTIPAEPASPPPTPPADKPTATGEAATPAEQPADQPSATGEAATPAEQPADQSTATGESATPTEKPVDKKKTSLQKKKAPKVKYKTGEDPGYAKKRGWPVKGQAPLPGAILPHKRIVAYYGNPQSKRMGVLGEYPKDEMLRRLKKEVAQWEKADPSLPVQPALHLVAVVAQGEPGKAGKYRMIMPDAVVNRVYGWAQENKAIMFIDIQTGHSNIRSILPRFEWLLKNPDVHLAMDPEFNMIKSGRKPGTKIGTYDAADVNYASGFLADLVKKYKLPPKVLIVHRFTRNMVTNAKKIVLRPEVQIVMNMDGWGAPWLKRDSYRDYIIAEPVQYTGFKLFYHNDTKKGDPLMTPAELLKLKPAPIYIQYQ